MSGADDMLALLLTEASEDEVSVEGERDGRGGRKERLPYMPRLPAGELPPEQAVRKTKAEITLVTKSDCALCHQARRVLEHAARRYRLQIEEVNAERDHPEVFATWKHHLPVVLIDGKRRFSGHVSTTLLEKALQTRVL